MDVEGRRSSLEVETLWTTPLASARLVRHGPCWHGDPSSETFDAPTVIFTRSGAWNIRRDENVRADPSIIVLGHEREHYRCSHRERVPSDVTMSITIAPRHLRPLLELHDSPTADAIMSSTLPDVGTHLSSARLGALATLLGTAGRDDLVSTDGLVLQLLAELHSPPAALEVGHERGSPAATIDRARQYLEAHYHERCSLHDLASAVHISPFHLHRRFRATTGKTPQQYLSSVRLRHARGALAQSERSIGAIAASVGFGSASSFSTWFKRETGLSPTTYRVHASSPTEPAARPHRDPKRSG